ncbi:MAG: hypothetical protein ACLFP4_07635 [Spirochaetales bacterium]
MNHEDMILGCERVARDLLYNDQPGTNEDAGQFSSSEEYHFAVQEHLAYTQMIIERHLAEAPIARRAQERERIDRFVPAIRELRRRLLATNGAL